MRTPRVDKLFGRFTVKDISFVNFDVPITTFAISVLCLGPSEMTEMIQTQKLKNKQKNLNSLCVATTATTVVPLFYNINNKKKEKRGVSYCGSIISVID